MQKLFKPYYYFIVVIAIAITTNYLSSTSTILFSTNLWCLLVINVLLEYFHVRVDNLGFSLGIAVDVLLLVFFGPLAAILGNIFSYIISFSLQRNTKQGYSDSLMKAVFNISQSIINVFVADFLIGLLDFSYMKTLDLWKLFVIIVVYYFTNALLITLIVSFQRGNFFDDLLNIKKNFIMFYFSLGITPALIYLFVDRGIIGVVLILLIFIPMQNIIAMQKRLMKQDEELHTDCLTGTCNFKSLQKALDEKIAAKDFFSLIMIDLNGFKQINDKYGHLVGNHVLREVALAIENSLSPFETFYRYGGDEFVVLVNSQIDPYIVAEKIRISIEGLSIPHKKNNIFVSLSYGIYQYLGEEITKEDIINNADAAMYRAKSNRKNIK